MISTASALCSGAELEQARVRAACRLRGCHRARAARGARRGIRCVRRRAL